MVKKGGKTISGGKMPEAQEQRKLTEKEEAIIAEIKKIEFLLVKHRYSRIIDKTPTNNGNSTLFHFEPTASGMNVTMSTMMPEWIDTDDAKTVTAKLRRALEKAGIKEITTKQSPGSPTIETIKNIIDVKNTEIAKSYLVSEKLYDAVPKAGESPTIQEMEKFINSYNEKLLQDHENHKRTMEKTLEPELIKIPADFKHFEKPTLEFKIVSNAETLTNLRNQVHEVTLRSINNATKKFIDALPAGFLTAEAAKKIKDTVETAIKEQIANIGKDGK